MEDIIIKIYDSEIEANVAKGRLEADNIRSAVITHSSQYGAKGKSELRVLVKDTDRAKEILDIK